MPRLPRPETPGPVLDHPEPTDQELYELLLLGLWHAHPNQRDAQVTAVSLGRMANGIFTTLVQIGVITEDFYKGIVTNYGFVMLVHDNCQTVRPERKMTAPDARAYVKALTADLFVALNPGQLYAHALLVAPQGYRLYLTDAGYKKAEALVAKYPNFTHELFLYGWQDYARRVRSTDIKSRQTDDAGGSA